MSRRALIACVPLFALGCAEKPPTWSEEIQPMVSRHCAGCHNEDGTAPFSLLTYEDAALTAEIAALAVAERRMPPWMPDPDCRTYKDERGLTDDEIERFLAWVDAGVPEGEATDPIVVDTVELAPDLSGEPVDPYTPSFDGTADDYHCFVLDLSFPEDTYVAGSQVIPGSTAVHHVLVYALEGGQIDAMEALDDADPGPGYTCFGGPLPVDGEGLAVAAVNFPTQIASWVPGMPPKTGAEDVGMRVAAGSKIVMQVHYSAVAADPVPDLTHLDLALHDTPPAKLARTRPLLINDLDIPAGASDVSFSTTVVNWRDTPVTVDGIAAHMHLLGQQQTIRVIRADGVEECALDIPDWDFDWQQSYSLHDDDTVVLAPGDGLELTCVYDNSAENQPVVNGAQQEPRDVEWGDGTLDEMCLAYVSVVEDNAMTETSPATPCESTADCMATCSDDELDCLLTCEDVDLSCLACVVDAAQACGITSCAVPLVAAGECLTDCGIGSITFDGGLGACIDNTCPDAIASFASCAQPTLDGGTCDTALSACGVAL